MKTSIQNYMEWKSAIFQAEQHDFNVLCRSDCVRLGRANNKRKKAPEHGFYEPNELFCYLNGLDDGEFQKS